MASATAANNTFQMSDEIYDKAKALYEVAVHEGGGSILKDYYTIFEYRDRRAKFFDKLPGWSRRPRDIYEMVKRDSNLFFDEDDPTRQMDALEVRERELEHQFEVLLPLPTTANTQTIDNFKTCPPIDGSREADEESEDQEQAAENGDYEVDEAEDDYDEDVEDGRDVPTPGGSLTHSTPTTSPVMVINLALDKKLAILKDPASIADLSDLATPMLPGLMRSKPLMPPPQLPVPTPAVDSLYTQKTTTSPKNFTVAPGVSAMSRYGMPGPIKAQQRQHTPEQAKMTASKPAASTTSKIVPSNTTRADQTDAAEPALKKQKTGHAAADSAKTPVIPTPSRPTANHCQPRAVSSIRPLAEVLCSHVDAADLATFISRLQDVSLYCTHRHSGDRGSRKSRCRTAGKRPSRRKVQQQRLQLPADLLQLPTHVHTIVLHVLPLDIDVDQDFDFD